MAHAANNQADPAEIETARIMWAKFTKLMKCSSIAAAVTLLFLALFVY